MLLNIKGFYGDNIGKSKECGYVQANSNFGGYRDSH